MEPFKRAMIEAGKRTLKFPNEREVFIREDITHAHGAVYEYRGMAKHIWCKTQEGLGNKNWIAEWMYTNSGTGKTYYDSIAMDSALMIVNDVIAQGAMPVVFTDHIDADSSDWYADEKRAKDLAEGFYQVCKMVGMAMPAGESASLTYLIKPKDPVQHAVSLAGSVTGIITPADNLISGKKLTVGDHIIGVPSSGLHANGVSLVIKKALELPDQFLTKLPSGRTLGEEALIPTQSYVALIDALLKHSVDIHALLPATGDGVGKLAFDSREYQYRIHSWGKVPDLFEYYRQVLGIAVEDCLKTFNWGMGYYIFAAPEDVEKILQIGLASGYQLQDIGIVEGGKRQVIFEPENIILAPPGQ